MMIENMGKRKIDSYGEACDVNKRLENICDCRNELRAFSLLDLIKMMF